MQETRHLVADADADHGAAILDAVIYLARNIFWSSDTAAPTSSSSAAEFGAAQQHSSGAENTTRLETRGVRVFVLAGQSNMVGRGKVAHLDELTKCGNSTESEFRDAIWDGRDYKTRDDVFVQRQPQQRHGNLTVRRRDEFSQPTCFGPELMFGWTAGPSVMPWMDRCC